MSTSVPGRVVRFVPGQAVAVVGDRFVALVDTDPRSDLVKELLRRTSSEDDPAEMIVTLASRGLRDLPSFAVVTSDGAACRVLVRGDIVVVLCLDDGREDMAFGGAGVTSWVEYHQTNVGSVSVHLADDLSEVGTFEITGGLVPANRLSWDLVGGAGPTHAAIVGPGTDRAVDESSDPPVMPDTNQLAAMDDAAAASETLAVSDNQTIRFAVDSVEATLDESDTEVEAASEPSGRENSPTPVDEVADEPDDYDHLFGATQYRPVSAAGINIVEDDPNLPKNADPAPAPTTTGLIAGIPGGSMPGPDSSGNDREPGDHDGLTMSLGQLRALHASGSMNAGDILSLPSTHAPSVMAAMVHAIVCDDGHPNPPTAAVCRVCGVEIPNRAHVTIPRPQLGLFRFSNGRDVAVSRPMLLGRSPKLDGPVSSEVPELVVLESPAKEISGTHLEVRIEGWQVLVVDRQSTNGTTVRLPQREPRRLHPGEAFPIVPGSLVDLAGEVSFRFEVAS